MIKTLKKYTEFSESQKIKKFDKIYKEISKLITKTINENYGYDDYEVYLAEIVLENLFGKSIFKLLNPDKRGENWIENDRSKKV
jgi:hypothetical protein